jgi:hypothetical protein
MRRFREGSTPIPKSATMEINVRVDQRASDSSCKAVDVIIRLHGAAKSQQNSDKPSFLSACFF